MMMKQRLLIASMVGFFSGIFSSLSFADYQPKIDDYLISFNRFKTYFTVSCQTVSRPTLISHWIPVTFPDQSTQLVLVSHQSESHQTVFRYEVGLNYGLTSKTEIGFSAATGSLNPVPDVTLLVSQCLFPETQYPSVYLSVSGMLSESSSFLDDQIYPEYWKSVTMGFTSFKSVDPLILVLDGRYAFHFPRTHQGITGQPSNSLTLRPSVYFSINSDITLLGGFALDFADQKTDWSYLMGMSYVFSEQWSTLLSTTLTPGYTTQTQTTLKILAKF